MAKIYEEIKQTKPFNVHGQEAHVTILRTSDVLKHAVERAIAPFGISHEQFNVLRILRGAGLSACERSCFVEDECSAAIYLFENRRVLSGA